MWGLGKKRTKLGKFLDKHNIEQEWLVRKSGLGRNTIGELANNFNRYLLKTMQKILKTFGKSMQNKADDFGICKRKNPPPIGDGFLIVQ